jgi:hypothetical protein
MPVASICASALSSSWFIMHDLLQIAAPMDCSSRKHKGQILPSELTGGGLLRGGVPAGASMRWIEHSGWDLLFFISALARIKYVFLRNFWACLEVKILRSNFVIFLANLHLFQKKFTSASKAVCNYKPCLLYCASVPSSNSLASHKLNTSPWWLPEQVPGTCM